VVAYRDGGAVEVHTGDEVLLLHSRLRVRPRTLVAALRPVAGPWRLDRDLARPALPDPVVSELERTHALHERTGRLAATARKLGVSTAVARDRLGLLRRLDALRASSRTVSCEPT
jgi:hypothetical protein